MADQSILLSVVVPCFNEESSLAATHLRLAGVLKSIPETRHEIIYVNDGSRDGTLDLLRSLAAKDAATRVISFSRNFGHQMALSAGAEFAQGDAVIVIDADLQDPPEVIPEMVKLWRAGNQVIYGQRSERAGESWLKLASAKYFYRILNRLSNVDIPLDAGDFRLMDRKVVNVLNRMPERDRFVRGMVSWIGFRQAAISYKRDKRYAGKTNYPLHRMVALAFDGMLSFSSKPLRVATGFGLFCSFLALLGILYALALRLFTDVWVEGWTLLFIAVMFIGGVQLICFGLLGEYVGRIYGEIKRRPLYIIDEKINFPPSRAEP
ncbi:MAG TPA: glycosyltransferase family 2 protein [Rhizomicrobium sp.]|nr:glycosyltransferase family 2 protein [Rhizomicrobium sp.]